MLLRRANAIPVQTANSQFVKSRNCAVLSNQYSKEYMKNLRMLNDDVPHFDMVAMEK